MAGIFDSIGGTFGGALGTAGSIAMSAIYGIGIFLVVGVIGYFIYKGYKNKSAYPTPITLVRIMDNGMEKVRHDLKGGIFWNHGIKDFKIKVPKQWKPQILGYIPDLSKSTSTDGRLKFITFGDGTIWQQFEEKWVLKGKGKDDEGNEFEYDLIKIPISRETKQVTVNSIKNWRDTVDKSKLTAFGIAIGAFIIMVIAHLISLYIQTKIKCGV